MNITRNSSNIHIEQCTYLEKVIEHCGMQNAKPAPTPLLTGYMPALNPKQSTPELCSHYQTVIGSLLYIMLRTRPDIAFAVTKLLQYSTNPSQKHLDKVLYIYRYLIGTRKYSLVFKGANNTGFVVCADSDWASDPSNRQSQTGYLLKLANAVFSWNSHAQKTIALLSTEAEYMALSDCSHQVVWICSLMCELGYHFGPISICGDNQDSIFISSNSVTKK